MHRIETFHPRIRQFIYLANHEWNHLPDEPDYSDPFFRIQGIKLCDGSPYTGSMYLEAVPCEQANKSDGEYYRIHGGELF